MPSSSGDSGIMDALTDPVSDAMAGIENPQSGTRLKGKFTMGADGSKEYQYSTYFFDPNANSGYGPLGVHAVWYDSMLQQDCTFLPATDNQLHCLPGTPTSGNISSSGILLLYTDGACTLPVVAQFQAGAGCVPYTTPQYVQSQNVTNGQCAKLTLSTTRVFKVGSPVAQPVTAYEGGPSACSSYSNTSNVMGWFAATEVMPSAFVQGTVGTDP
jgi:hypothetical protein